MTERGDKSLPEPLRSETTSALRLWVHQKFHVWITWKTGWSAARIISAPAAARIVELQGLCDRLKLEAQIHAGEARAANATIYKIYQVLTGGKGEPGNWHGAEPAREYVTRTNARIAELEARKS